MRNHFSALAPLAAIVGGLLWIIYAILLMLHPWGAPLRAGAASGPFATAALTGAAALACLALALLATARRGLPIRGAGRFGAAMGWTGLLAAAAATVGGLVQQATLCSAALIAGEVLIAFGVLLVATDAAGEPHSSAAGSALFLVGVVGMLGLMAQALVAVTAWMLPIYAALVMAVYGLAWVRFGGWLWRQT